MLTKKQLEILNVFKKEPFRSLSLSELKRELRESSSSKFQRSIFNFKKEKLINIKKAGKTHIISLNYENNKLFYYLSIFGFESNKNIPFEILYKIQQEILKETEFFSLVVFGSYAESKQTAKSDLDVAVIVENQEIKKRIAPRIASVKRKAFKEIHEQIFTRNEFLEMLRNEEENVGKEINRKHFVFYGLINFYKLILKGAKWKD